MMFGGHLLSLLIWLPIVGGFAVLILEDRAARWLSLLISGLSLVLSMPLFALFKNGTAAMQFVERAPWISTIHAEYYIGVDGISMPLILLTTFTTVLIVIASWSNVEKRVAQYFAAFLILEGLMIGVFAAMDGALFYVLWEAMLIPMFIIIGVWGGPRRVYATIKFFLYTFVGSLLMLVALIYLYLKSGSYELAVFQRMPLTLTEQTFIFFAFFAAFAVKVPMWPVHTWLPDAHVEAPTGGSVVLAAIMLKMGGYGFLRFSLPIAPDASRHFDWLIIALSLIAVLYIAFVALVQRDMKKLIAYSSIAHMGFVTLGMFIGFQIVAHTGRTTGIELGLDGAVVQMLSHGLVSGAMFLCVGVMYDRVHSREISAYGGVINTMPKFAAFMVLFALANSGLPGTSGFIGEFMVILASFKANVWYAFLAATILVLGAAYTLWLIKRVIYGAGRQRQGGRTHGSQRPGILGARRACRGGAAGWPVARAAARRDARHHAAFSPAVAGLEDRSVRLNDARSRPIQCQPVQFRTDLRLSGNLSRIGRLRNPDAGSAAQRRTAPLDRRPGGHWIAHYRGPRVHRAGVGKDRRAGRAVRAGSDGASAEDRHSADGGGGVRVFHRLSAVARHSQGRVLRAGPVCRFGCDGADLGRQPDLAVSGLGIDVAVACTRWWPSIGSPA